MKNKKIGESGKEAILQLCTLITIICLVWIFAEPFLNSLDIFFKVLFILIFGIGAIGLYLPIANSIRNFYNIYT